MELDTMCQDGIPFISLKVTHQLPTQTKKVPQASTFTGPQHMHNKVLSVHLDRIPPSLPDTDLSPTPTGSEQAAGGVEERGQWWGSGDGLKQTLLDWLKSGDVEGQVDSHE